MSSTRPSSEMVHCEVDIFADFQPTSVGDNEGVIMSLTFYVFSATIANKQ